MLEASQYPTSNYTIEPYNKNKHGIGTKTDKKANGSE
jgi:hypothetical protein